MVVKALDEIVLDEAVRSSIEPFFMYATRSGDVSFDHDWQWQAYCDLIYALIRYPDDDLSMFEQIESSTKGHSTFIKRRMTETELLNILKEFPQRLRKYSPSVRSILQQSLDMHGLTVMEDSYKYLFLRNLPAELRKAVDFINEADDGIIEVCASLMPADIGLRSDTLGYFDQLYDFLKAATEQEITELGQAIKGEGFFSGKEERLREVVSRVISYDYRYRNDTRSRVTEAIECVAIGEQKELAGYRVICKVGEGGGRNVYKAYYWRDEAEVAIKVQKEEESSKSPHRKKRETEYGREKLAAHEGRFARGLTHQNLVRYFDRGTFADKREFIIEEYIEGNTLEDEIREGTALYGPSKNSFSFDVVLAIDELLQAVSYLHERKCAHLDLKPANVLIYRPNGLGLIAPSKQLVKVGDLEFVQRIFGRGATTENYGSRMYTAPELLEKKQLSLRADVFSLGIILYELFEIEHPFLPAKGPFKYQTTNIEGIDDNDNPYEIKVPIKQVDRNFSEEDKQRIARNICDPAYYATLEQKIKSSTVIPEKYKQAIARCLKYNPEERYQDAIQIQESLLEIESKKEKKREEKGNFLESISAFILTVAAVIGGVSIVAVVDYYKNDNPIISEFSKELIMEMRSQRLAAAVWGEYLQTGMSLDEQIERQFPEQNKQEFQEHLAFISGNLNIPVNPYSWETQCLLAQHLITASGPVGSKADYRQLAVDVLERTIQEEPLHPMLHYFLGMTYIDQGRIAYGIAELEETRSQIIQGAYNFLAISPDGIDTTLGILYASSGDIQGGVLKLGDAYHAEDHTLGFTRKDYCIALEQYEAENEMPFKAVSEEERAAMKQACCFIDCYDKFEPDSVSYPFSLSEEEGRIKYCDYVEPFHCFGGEKIVYNQYWMKRLKEELAAFHNIETGQSAHIACLESFDQPVVFQYRGTATPAWYAR